jgi:hypothetical protein
MNKLYRDLIIIRAEAAVAAAQAAASIDHPGLKGELCEIVMRDLLRPLLPADIALGTGLIIAANNDQSREQDVVLIDRSIVPPVVFEGATGIYPIESVLFAIEVKKKLDAGEMDKSIKNAIRLSQLRLLPGKHDDNDVPIDTYRWPPVSAILAFGSDLTLNGTPELERFLERLNAIPGYTADDPPIQVICVVGRGCWFWKKSEWICWPSGHRLQEVISFIATIMNTYKRIRETRGAPRLGEYLLERT